MITKEEFFKYLEAYKTFDSGINRMAGAITGNKYLMPLYETDWGDAVGRMLDIFLESHFTEKGSDWVSYYLFEDIEDKKVTISIEGDMFRDPGVVEYHLNSIDELWDFLQTNVKLYFKE